ncbi:MAG: hypothetical protein ACRCWG_12220 [Sarcina sp.]
MNIENLDLYNFINNYKKGVENILRNKSIKALEGEFLIISNELNIQQTYAREKLSADLIKELLDLKNKLYFPFVGGFDSYVISVNGAEFDLDEGIEPEWIEGAGYIPSGSRLVDIGDFTISYRNLAGFIIEENNGSYKVTIAEYLKGSNSIKRVENTGLLGIEIKSFIKSFVV